MTLWYSILIVLTAVFVAFSGLQKVRHDPKVTRIIHDVVGVPMTWFPFLAACEFAGAAGLLGGLLWPPIGLAAAAGLVLYFVGAMAAHVRVGDVQGLGPAAFMLFVSAASLILGLMR